MRYQTNGPTFGPWRAPHVIISRRVYISLSSVTHLLFRNLNLSFAAGRLRRPSHSSRSCRIFHLAKLNVLQMSIAISAQDPFLWIASTVDWLLWKPNYLLDSELTSIQCRSNHSKISRFNSFSIVSNNNIGLYDETLWRVPSFFPKRTSFYIFQSLKNVYRPSQ